MKYEVTYKVVIEVDAKTELEAHEKSDEELDELIEGDNYYMWCELVKYPRQIKLIVEKPTQDEIDELYKDKDPEQI